MSPQRMGGLPQVKGTAAAVEPAAGGQGDGGQGAGFGTPHSGPEPDGPGVLGVRADVLNVGHAVSSMDPLAKGSPLDTGRVIQGAIVGGRLLAIVVTASHRASHGVGIKTATAGRPRTP